jgi:hypothetical protein
MASLGTLAAELKLEGAAAMIAGLRGAAGAVSILGRALAGARRPLAQFDGALPRMWARNFAPAAPRLPAVGRPARSLGSAPRLPAGSFQGKAPIPATGPVALQAGRPPRVPQPGAGRQDFAGALRGILGQFQTSIPSRRGEGDRLARVGGFIGGGGGPALDYHRRTAAATEKAALTLQTLVQHWAGPNAAPAPALWS